MKSENIMKITLESYRHNPNLRFELEAAARTERSRQIARFVKSLFATKRSAGVVHAARSHLSPQG